MHRSVNPSTISLGKDGVVKLGGFALAKILSEDPDTTVGPRDAIYMAPEQRISEKVDVYAAGLLLWELLTGRPPPENVSFSPACGAISRASFSLLSMRLSSSNSEANHRLRRHGELDQEGHPHCTGPKEVRERVAELATANDFSHEPTVATADRADTFRWSAGPPSRRPWRVGSFGGAAVARPAEQATAARGLGRRDRCGGDGPASGDGPRSRASRVDREVLCRALFPRLRIP